jgi:hypothetical protein
VSTQLKLHHAERILRRERTASSSPVVADTDGGTLFVKLRGAAQGTAALIAEVIVASLAEALGLSVPARSLVTLDADTPTDDRNDELAQLLGFSHGLNLGFTFLDNARNLRSDETELIDEETASKIVWLDALASNPDRTAKNTNIMWWRSAPWLIDHGAALGFQYDWSRVDEKTPVRPYPFDRHLLNARATKLQTIWPSLVERLPREAIERAVAEVPDDFLLPLIGDTPIERRRAAYVAVLWKRLRSDALTYGIRK